MRVNQSNRQDRHTHALIHGINDAAKFAFITHRASVGNEKKRPKEIASDEWTLNATIISNDWVGCVGMSSQRLRATVSAEFSRRPIQYAKKWLSILNAECETIRLNIYRRWLTGSTYTYQLQPEKWKKLTLPFNTRLCCVGEAFVGENWWPFTSAKTHFVFAPGQNTLLIHFDRFHSLYLSFSSPSLPNWLKLTQTAAALDATKQRTKKKVNETFCDKNQRVCTRF